MPPTTAHTGAVDASTDRHSPPLGRGGGEVRRALGLRQAGAAGRAGGQKQGLGQEPHRRLHRRRPREARLLPAPEADRVTLIRRLSFDLTGLPPTPEEVDAFVKDQTPDAYEKLVDRLLASPHYGERMAAYWLDLVRYADTAGYHSDNHRDVWLYRDYVIDAFNTEQAVRPLHRRAAGRRPAAQRRPSSSGSRRATTACCRPRRRAGRRPKEYTAKYAADRVRNASVVWLASTLGCAECHDHKFDPFTNKDFYSFEAFFADVQEAAVGRQVQTTLSVQGARGGGAQARRADRGGQGGLRAPDAGTGRRPGGVGKDGAGRQGGAEAAGRRDRGPGRRAGQAHAAAEAGGFGVLPHGRAAAEGGRATSWRSWKRTRRS